MSEEETRHAMQVLRHRVGNVLQLIDGRGGWFEGRIVAAEKRSCLLQVSCLRREERRAGYKLTLAVAPTKQMERLEWLVEKSTEIGLDTFIPLLTKRGERSQVRVDRLEKEALAATKQSLQAWMPTISRPLSLADCLAACEAEQRFIGWCEEENPPLLAHNCKAGKDVMILIGPEGDFTAEEVALAKSYGFVPISLGPNRLRTETAALAACHSVQMLNL